MFNLFKKNNRQTDHDGQERELIGPEPVVDDDIEEDADGLLTFCGYRDYVDAMH